MTLSEALREKELFIFDMDGTIYLGSQVFPFAVSFINRLREHGKRVMFFTNNASRDPLSYLERLEGMGFCPRREEILTSGDVTIAYLNRHRAGKSVYLVGTPALEEQFRAQGIPLSENAGIVVSSFDTTLTYHKLEVACSLIHGGAEFFSTHPDFNCPTETGFLPDSGAIAALITASTGKTPTYFGKPYREAAEMMSELGGVPLEKTVVFGDRLYTDIALGKRNGITSVLVLTGETKREDADAALPEFRPDFIAESLAEADRAMFGE